MRQIKVLRGSPGSVLRTGLLLILLFALSLPSVVRAAPGDLDPTFGSGGKVTTDFGRSEFASALVLQPDGKIVVAGQSFVLGTGSDSFALRQRGEGHHRLQRV